MISWRLKQLKTIFWIIAFLLIFLDGTLSLTVLNALRGQGILIFPALLLAWFFFGVQFSAVDINRRFWIYVAILGIFYDGYYTQFYFSFTIPFLLATYVFYRLSIWNNALKVWQAFTNYLAGFFVFLAIYYLINFIGGVASFPTANNIITIWLPTIVLNAMVVILMFYPIRTLFTFIERINLE